MTDDWMSVLSRYVSAQRTRSFSKIILVYFAMYPIFYSVIGMKEEI